MSKHSTKTKVRYKSLAFMNLFQYRVGDDGSVWSKRVKGDIKGQIGPWWRLKDAATQAGYRSVSLSVWGEGKMKTHSVHKLVLLTFVGPCPEGMWCRHLNGKPWDNRLKNLCWGTPKENAADKKRHGTQLCGERASLLRRGEKHGCAVLNERQVMEIRKLYASGEKTQTELAVIFGVSQATTNRIILGKGWKFLPTIPRT